MGVGISCKNGLNLHLGEMLTNYATNRFESRRRQKSSAIDQLNKSKSDSSLFTVVSTKSLNDEHGEQFDPWKRRKEKPLDEHEASQVIYFDLPNNESLFIEQLNCDLCSQRFVDEDGGKEFAEQQKLVNKRLEAIINQSTTEQAGERPANQTVDSLDEHLEQLSTDNDSLKTIKSMKILSTSAGEPTSLNDQELDYIDAEREDYPDGSCGTARRLSSIEEESHQEEHAGDVRERRRFLRTPRLVAGEDEKSENESPDRDELETKPNNESDRLPARRSSVKVQMASLEVPFSFASTNKLHSLHSPAGADLLESKQRLKMKKFKLNSKVKQSLRFSVDSDSILNGGGRNEDEDSSDEQLKEIGLEEKQQMLKEMIESAKREQFRQIENLSFYSNSINDLEYEQADNELGTELIRSFSADYVRDLLTDQLLNDLVELDYIDYKLSKIGTGGRQAEERLMYSSDTDLNKLKENRAQLDNKSISTLRTELLNLDAIEKELADRDQLENVALDEADEENDDEENGNANRLNSMNNRLAVNGSSDGRLLNNFGSNIRSKFSLKVGLADYSLLAGKQFAARAVTKTKRKEDLNKRSLVNSWLTREQFDQDDYNSLLSFNQSFSQPFSRSSLSQSPLSQHHLQHQQQISSPSPFGGQQISQFPFGQPVPQSIPDCTVDDCNLCRLNEEKLNELDSDVLQLMHVLQTLDEILQEKELQLQQLAEKSELSPSHSTLCASNKQKLVRSRANLKKKVNMLKKRSSRLGISMSKSEEGRQLIVFRDGKSTYHIELGDRKSHFCSVL